MPSKRKIANKEIAKIFSEFERLNDSLRSGLTPLSVNKLKEYIIKLEDENGKMDK